ncbi:two-component sensor histidine kinase [Marinomonas agarivorans]|nr:two-component sensor histidine kinase [Marinomonas agarivorans]
MRMPSFTPIAVEQVIPILQTYILDSASSLGQSRNFHPIYRDLFAFLETREDLLDQVYMQFLNSAYFNENLKRQVLELSCCWVISEYPYFYPDQGVSSAFLAERGYGFIWPVSQDSNLFVQLDYDFDYGLFLIVSVFSVVILIILFIVWRELINLDYRLTLRGIILSNGSGVLKELSYTVDPVSSHVQRLLKVQREMINAISHELRTPIARLRFGLEVVKDEVLDADLITISALEDDIEELNSLVDEVLTYGKLEEGSLNLNFEKVNMRRLIDGILNHNSLFLSHLSITVDCLECEDSDLVVMADVHHLHRALQNLILNAGKYAHSKVHIHFKQHDENWQIDVEDDGPGVKVEDREKVFVPFQRLDDSRTRASGGYGLGLAIVQRIAFWHGGSVSVGESRDGGAKFTFFWSRSYHQKSKYLS